MIQRIVQLIKTRFQADIFRKNIAAVAVLAGASLAVLWPIFSQNGWPLNHEGNGFFIRTGIYSQHISDADFFPVWSSKDNFGFGSPQPVLYHKLFYLVSGLVQSLLPQLNVELVVVITIYIFLLLGALGIYALCKKVGTSTISATSAAVMLVSANYTTINWLVRGAMAEFSAAMLVPWVVLILIKSVEVRRFSCGLSVLFVLLFLAHSALAFLVVLLTGIAVMVISFQNHSYLVMFHWRRLAKPFLIGIGVLTPYALAMMRLGMGYNLRRMTNSEYLPQNNFVSASKYFFDSAWHWGNTYLAMTVEIGKPLLLLSAIALVVLVVSKLRKTANDADEFNQIATNSLMSIGIVVVILQTKLSIPVYKYLPGAQYIQFPWRLEAVLIPVLIVGCVVVLHRSHQRYSSPLLAIASIAALISAGSFSPIRYERMTYQSTDSNNLQFSAFNEYVPVVASYFSQNTFEQIELFNLQNRCTLQTTQRELEGLDRTYMVHCDIDAIVVLPEFSSDFHLIQVDSETKVQCRQGINYPGLCTVNVNAGNHEIHIWYPTLWRVIRGLIT